MTLEDIIIFIRQQLLELQSENDSEAVKQLLDTCKTLTKAAYESNDLQTVDVLVRLSDSARDLHMGKPLNGQLPTEDDIRKAVVTVKATSTPAPQPTPMSAVKQDGISSVDETPEPPAPDVDVQPELDAEEQVQQRLRKLSERNWYDYTVIRDGSPRQMRAYSVVFDELMVFLHMKPYKPVWVGSYPLGIDAETSDINILLEPEQLRVFLVDVRKHYGHHDDFKLVWKAINKTPTIVARFQVKGFWVDMFAQCRPLNEQDAFVQMLMTARLLAIGGDEACEGIRQNKTNGQNTPDAIMAYFNIETDNAQQKLLDYARFDNDRLRREVEAKRNASQNEQIAVR